MRIELLYLPGCPNYEPALQRLRETLAQERVTAAIVEVAVADQITAEQLGFPGSPTVRIDGIDVDEPEAPQAGSLSCRTYAADGRRQGVPPVELIRRAIQAARNRREES